MKNADMPAMPTLYADLAPNGQRELYCTDLGLTKREMFAMHAMQGAIASDTKGAIPPEVTARYAVAIADALLEELSK